MFKLMLVDERNGQTVAQWSKLSGPVVTSVVQAIGSLVPTLQGLAAVRAGLEQAGLLPARPARGARKGRQPWES
jgi:hypothetical protein